MAAKRKKYPITLKNTFLGLLVIVIVAQFFCIGFLARDYQKFKSHATANEQMLEGAVSYTVETARLYHSDVSVSSKAVYLPRLNLKLPLNDTTAGLVYGAPAAVGNFPDVVYGVTSFNHASVNWEPLPTSCMPIELTFSATPHPSISDATQQNPVKLADGRILHVYASNNKNKCDDQWRAAGVNPDKLAAEFESAQSYKF